MKEDKQAKELGLVLSGVLIGIAIGSWIESERASKSRLSSRVFDLEQAARRSEGRPENMPPVPVVVVTEKDSR